MRAASPGVDTENAARSEFTPWNVEIDEEQIMILTQADTHTFQKSLGKVVLISGIVWSCLCSEVSVVEFFNSIGGVEVNKEIPCVPFIFQFFYAHVL